MYPTKKLSEICDIQNGYAFKSDHYTENGARLIRITNVQSGYIGDDNPKFLPLSYIQNYDDFSIQENDILISLTGNVGRVGVFPRQLLPALLNQRVGRFIKIKDSQIDRRYLFLYLNSTFFVSEVIRYAEGAAQKNTSTKKIKDIEIPLPPLSTQSRIVARLNSAFASIDEQISLLRANIADVENMRKSVLVETFNKNNHELLKISDIAEIINGGTPDTTIPDYWNGEIFWITPKDMGQLENIYVSETSRKITGEGVNNSSAKIIPVNSVILSSRAPIGHLAINTVPMCTNQGCKGLVPGDELDHIYLYYFLLYSRDLLNSLGSGTTFKELSSTKLKEVEIPLPPLSHQHEIVAHLDRVFAETEALRSEYEAQIGDLEILKQSLLEEAFAGRLVSE